MRSPLTLGQNRFKLETLGSADGSVDYKSLDLKVKTTIMNFRLELHLIFTLLSPVLTLWEAVTLNTLTLYEYFY